MAKVKITYGELKRGAAQMLSNAGIESPTVDVRILLEKTSHKSASELILCDQEFVPETILTEFHELLGYRLAHEPIAYILGEKAFWSLDFKVNEHVLIPRPETEGLVERTLALCSAHPAPHILDIGTGSGAIIISLLHERPSATGLGVDLSHTALDVARLNAEHHSMGNRCRFTQSDFLKTVTEKFDVVVSNPPYIDDAAMTKLAPDVELYEPELALRGGKDGLSAYRTIIANVKKVLNPGGYLVFEIGFDQKTPVCNLLHRAGASDVICQQDLSGLNRVVSAKF